MPAKLIFKRRIGRAGIVRRIPQAVREITYPALIKAAVITRDHYRKNLRAKHRITGLTARTPSIRRSKRVMLVQVGLFESRSRKNIERRKTGPVTPVSKAKWLEFGTKKGMRQKARPTFIPIWRRVRRNVPRFVRSEWNRHADIVFAKLNRGVNVSALRANIRI